MPPFSLDEGGGDIGFVSFMTSPSRMIGPQRAFPQLRCGEAGWALRSGNGVMPLNRFFAVKSTCAKRTHRYDECLRVLHRTHCPGVYRLMSHGE